jgi:hypothetical protein
MIEHDFIINKNGDIRHIKGRTNHYTILEFYNFLEMVTNNWSKFFSSLPASTMAVKHTDYLIRLTPPNNIDEASFKYLHSGTIIQGTGKNEQFLVRSGLKK